MKKRTACFGWTKRMQRARAEAASLASRGQTGRASLIESIIKVAYRKRVAALTAAQKKQDVSTRQSGCATK